jgi:hypothetical protein
MTAVRDPGQRMHALQHANDVRSCVAGFKRETASLPREEAVVAVIDAIEHRHADPLLGAARVRHLLMSIDHIGETKARKLIHVAQVYSGDKRLRDLTARQRGLLVQVLLHEKWRKR